MEVSIWIQFIVHLLVLINAEKTQLEYAISNLAHNENNDQSYKSLEQVWNSLNKFWVSNAYTGSNVTINQWGVHLSSRKHNLSLDAASTADLLEPLSLNLPDGVPLCQVTPHQVHTKSDAVFSVIAFKEASDGTRFSNNNESIQIISPVVGYHWIFTVTKDSSLKSHEVKFYHLLDAKQVAEENFVSSQTKCLEWVDGSNDNGAKGEWHESQSCIEEQEDEQWTKCRCNDFSEISDPHAVGIVGKRKVVTSTTTLPPTTQSIPLHKQFPSVLTTEHIQQESENIQVLTDDILLDPSTTKETVTESKDQHLIDGGDLWTSKYRLFEFGDGFIFEKILNYMQKSIESNVKQINDIVNLPKLTEEYVLNKDTEVHGAKIAIAAFNYQVGLDGVRFPPSVSKHQAHLTMPREFLQQFMYMKTMELGFAVTDRDLKDLSDGLQPSDSIASDVATISLRFPKDDPFSAQQLKVPLKLSIPLTKGQKVRNPKCYWIQDAKNVVKHPHCDVENYESGVIICSCRILQGSFVIVDSPPSDVMMQTSLEKSKKVVTCNNESVMNEFDNVSTGIAIVFIFVSLLMLIGWTHSCKIASTDAEKNVQHYTCVVCGNILITLVLFIGVPRLSRGEYNATLQSFAFGLGQCFMACIGMCFRMALRGSKLCECRSLAKLILSTGFLLFIVSAVVGIHIHESSVLTSCDDLSFHSSKLLVILPILVSIFLKLGVCLNTFCCQSDREKRLNLAQPITVVSEAPEVDSEQTSTLYNPVFIPSDFKKWLRFAIVIYLISLYCSIMFWGWNIPYTYLGFVSCQVACLVTLYWGNFVTTRKSTIEYVSSVTNRTTEPNSSHERRDTKNDIKEVSLKKDGNFDNKKKSGCYSDANTLTTHRAHSSNSKCSTSTDGDGEIEQGEDALEHLTPPPDYRFIAQTSNV